MYDLKYTCTCMYVHDIKVLGLWNRAYQGTSNDDKIMGVLTNEMNSERLC